MRQDVNETLEVSHLEMLRRVSIYGDLEAWAAFQQSLEETVLNWLHAHPGGHALQGGDVPSCESFRGNPGDAAGLLSPKSRQRALVNRTRPAR